MIDNNYDAQSDPSQPGEGVGRVESLPKWPFPCCPLFFFFCANLRRFGRISVGLFFKERKRMDALRCLVGSLLAGFI